MTEKPLSIDAYCAGLNSVQHAKLVELRRAFIEAIPIGTEKISYAMPAFAMRKKVICYAAWEHHVAVLAGLAQMTRYLRH